MESKKIGVVDLFCGIGGLSHGMFLNGFDILSGYDIDSTCEYAFEKNNKSKFYARNIKEVNGTDISSAYKKDQIKVLAGCAPCQPFSSYSFKIKEKDQNKYDLLYEFGRLVKESKPDIITMENVVQILSFKQKPVLEDFKNTLIDLGYHVSINKVFCPDYGIPQRRTRIVLLASRFGEIEIIPKTHSKDNYITVRQAIGNLPRIEAGEVDRNDKFHRSRNLNEINLKRIKATPEGGSWKDWPEALLLECHKRDSGKSFGSVYGRMKWDEPSPTMTTLCIGLGNGRFGHPEQDRAISLREAAILQSFPNNYSFFENEDTISLARASRYIGNAVPPKLGDVIAKSIKVHLEFYGKV
ncbi:DNA cytosine methyltransferase [Sphingobacterium sp. G1-14]|uniref:DNA cytosine methyltransferase n=1 Tax=Sphingobacterium sp. G1-14 TaxID=2003121 RepID=UPI000B48C3A1|nr:DNA (cytosine-5-)-methyltransferase [Sphingobacterium sp. G1-14]